MNDQFIPLVPSDVIASATTPKASFAQIAPTAATGPSTRTGHSPPKVTLKRNGDQVTHISVRCTCGETIELACMY